METTEWFIWVSFLKDFIKDKVLIIKRINWFTKGISIKVKRKVRDCIFYQQSLIMKVNFKTICFMDKES